MISIYIQAYRGETGRVERAPSTAEQTMRTAAATAPTAPHKRARFLFRFPPAGEGFVPAETGAFFARSAVSASACVRTGSSL